jgi:hypothetical protein
VVELEGGLYGSFVGGCVWLCWRVFVIVFGSD